MGNSLTKIKHQGKAAITAGYSPRHARQSAYQALESTPKTAPELLARHGLDDDSLIDEHLLPLMNAEETKFFTLPVGKSKDRRRQIESRKTANGALAKMVSTWLSRFAGCMCASRRTKARSSQLS